MSNTDVLCLDAAHIAALQANSIAATAAHGGFVPCVRVHMFESTCNAQLAATNLVKQLLPLLTAVHAHHLYTLVIVVDAPVARSLTGNNGLSVNNCNLSAAQVTKAMIEYTGQIRHSLRHWIHHALFYWSEPVQNFSMGKYPAYGPEPNNWDLHSILVESISMLRAQHAPISGFVAACPYAPFIQAYSLGMSAAFQKLYDVHTLINSYAFGFGITFDTLTGGSVSAKQYSDEVLSFLIRLERADPRNLQVVDVRSTTLYPVLALPETLAYTMSWLTDHVFSYFP